MPEFYPSIGEAVGATMQHNIGLADGSETSGSDKPLQVRYLPHPSADPYSVPGMIARLAETATPDEVAGIIEEVNGALVGALPQLTELVAAAADWTRVRLVFDDPNHNPTFETWTRLAAAHSMLRDVQEQLEIAENGIAACPAELTDPRNHEMVNVLRTRELLSDVLSADAVASAPTPADGNPEANRQRAARTSSPNAAAQRTTSPASSAGASASAPPPRAPAPDSPNHQLPSRTGAASMTSRRAPRDPPPSLACAHSQDPPCPHREPARPRPPPGRTRSSTSSSAHSASRSPSVHWPG
ncbi:hypothetical protein [Streptomyces atratus]|uniref:hypothetical protein n=1 Tax=Streptomyces atratus TaxID=1893 RepID=UPI0022543D1A|nr:hypothetical protein [Streptomyces atratus]MCX5340271.1 hypothetical protein [Streptomyces atratus]